MPAHQQSRISTFLLSLIAFHIIIIAASNYLVQIPITIAGFHSTWGTFTFPLIFLATDLTVRLLGAETARKVILKVMIPALIISYVISVIFFKGQFQGLEGLASFNSFVFRIAFASFIAYVVGQLVDILVFNSLRRNASWWVAPSASTVLGALIDTFVFFGVAFYASSDEFMAANWIEIAWVDYAFKLLVSLIFFIPAYGIIVNKMIGFAGKNTPQH